MASQGWGLNRSSLLRQLNIHGASGNGTDIPEQTKIIILTPYYQATAMESSDSDQLD